MSRNTTGTYSLPTTGNPVQTGTTVSSTWANATLSDIATELTNSLDRSGRGAMLAPLQVQDGTSAAPSVTFASETTSGLYRAGTGDVRYVVTGTEVAKAKADGTFTMNAPVVGTSHLLLNGGNPGSTTAFKNYVTPKNICKAWASVSTNGSGGITLLDGFNIASVVFDGGGSGAFYATVNFAQAFANNNYCLVGTTDTGAWLAPYGGAGTGKTTTYAHCAAYIGVSSVRNMQTNATEFYVVFYGAQ
jgi:hypothetical protein